LLQSSLNEGRSHVPYYESKLTTLLKSAFGGNARTLVMVNTRSEEAYSDETLQTLRFGERCSTISNQLKTLATSFEDTVSALTSSINTLAKQLDDANARRQRNKRQEKTEHERFLELSHNNLVRKRDELVAMYERNQKHAQMMKLVDMKY
jgi:flagellar hook-associated protein FlgK